MHKQNYLSFKAALWNGVYGEFPLYKLLTFLLGGQGDMDAENEYWPLVKDHLSVKTTLWHGLYRNIPLYLL